MDVLLGWPYVAASIDGSAHIPDGGGLVGSQRSHGKREQQWVRYADGPLAGAPAITRNAFGNGAAWYVSTHLGQRASDRLIADMLAGAGVPPVAPDSPPGLELVRRCADDGRSWLFVLNHSDNAHAISVRGTELLTARQVTGVLDVAPGGVAVIREEAEALRHHHQRREPAETALARSVPPAPRVETGGTPGCRGF